MSKKNQIQHRSGMLWRNSFKPTNYKLMKYSYSYLHSKSDYIYAVREHVIAIKDLNLGRMSVTNNIESIVAHISEKENINPEDYTIIYQDSEKTIDGFNWKTKRFEILDIKLQNKCARLLP